MGEPTPRRLTRRRALLTLSAVGAAGLLAACSNQAAPPAPAKAEPNEPAESSKPAQAPAAGSSNPFNGITLKVSMFDTAYSQAMKALLPQFEEQTGMKVDLELLGFVVYNQRADLDLLDGSGANDVMTLVFVQSNRWIDAGWITDLTPLIEDPKLTDKAALDLDDFASGGLTIFRRGQSLYGLPFFAGGSLMVYRKDILDKHGISKPPDTFEELLEVAKRVHTPEVPAYLSYGQTNLDFVWANYLYGFGGSFFADPPDDLTPQLNSQAAVTSLNIYADLVKNYAPPGLVSFGDGEMATIFPQGKAAMWFDDIGTMAATLDPRKSTVIDKIAFAPVPQGPMGRYPQVGTHALMIPAGAKRTEASWEFIKWAISKETMGRIGGERFYPAVTRDSATQRIQSAKQYQFADSNVATLHHEVLKLAGSGHMKYRAVPVFPQFRDAVNGKLAEIISGQRSVKDGLDAAQQDTSALLEGAGYKIRHG